MKNTILTLAALAVLSSAAPALAHQGGRHDPNPGTIGGPPKGAPSNTPNPGHPPQPLIVPWLPH